MRAIWEGWVAIVDKKRSETFHNLVNMSDKIIPELPFEQALQKESFIAPDFTSLDVMTFAAESLPKGINIPNYNEIREKEGFKNVIFESNTPTNRSKWHTDEYISIAESDYINEHRQDAYKVQVGGHELFGHGSGKLMVRGADGKCPMSFVDPINGEKFESCYEAGETYNSKFGQISSSYEECRADLSGLHLQSLQSMYQVFGYNETSEDQKNLLWTNLMLEVEKGVLGIPTAYSFENK